MKQPAAFHHAGQPPANRSCLVAFADIVGEIHGIETDSSGYVLAYRAIDPAAVRAMVQARPGASELTYPLRRKLGGAETVQTPAYWNNRAADPESLDADEGFLREQAATLLAPNLRSGDLVFDPACSTGRFLQEIGQRAPGCRLRGQELSPQMVAIARRRLADVRLGSADQPACADAAAQLLICRFLNLDVVTTDQARGLFGRLVQCVAPGGRMLVVGHTPVLLTAADMTRPDLALEKSHMLTPDGHALYQFYLLKRCG